MKKDELEIKLKNIFDFTNSFIEENGFPPSIRDICNAFKIKSTATAYLYINKLEKKGLLTKLPNKKRSITLDKKHGYKNIPLIGTVRAGLPILAVENIEGYYPLPTEIVGDNCFALRVFGDSMINAGINNNDIIIVDKCDYAVNGDIIVALIEDSATVKRFYKKNNKIILHPENDYMEDLIFDDIKIIGKVKGLYRRL